MENKWKEICYLMQINKKSSEDLFQTEVVNVFEKLGWSRFKKEIQEKKKIDVGAAKSLIPDIIIKYNDKDLFVVELKKMTARQSDRNYSQLSSYMRQLKLNIGVLIGNKIQVFYEDPNRSCAVEIMSIDFNENDENGIDFIKYFSKENFNLTELELFLSKHLQKLDIIDTLTSSEYISTLNELITNDLSKFYDKSVIALALKTIEIDIHSIVFNRIEDIVDDLSINKKVGIPEYYNINTDESEIEKVKGRIPRWLNKPHQINSRILLTALDLLEKEKQISYSTLESKCSDIDKFKGNFDQMANFGPKNHGKVFERKGDIVTLWSPVKDFVIDTYLMYKQKH